ncbi:AsmA family protein [Cerasicoccus fimbriatus]|uniref:AsmA family protein n=1 Tax=Cerasicoccus fimbriatus TaxID=3014554 RepID=UPI0022B5A76E|nr:AsmA family protein [Cerasicoccus sp. TK19100]
MKKFLKVILILAVLLILVVVIAAVVVTRPGFQKSIFLSSMEGKVDKVQVETLSAGMSKVDVQDLEIEKNGALIKLGDLQLQYSLWDFVFGKELRIDELVIDKLYVDTTKMKPSGDKSDDDEPSVEGGAPKFEGIFDNAEIPLKIYLGKADINGQVVMPKRQLTFFVTGGDIAPGKEGKLTLKGDLIDQTPGAAAGKLAVNGELKLNQTSEQKLDRVSFVGDISASGGALSKPATLTIAASAEDKSETEEYILTLSRDNKQLAQLDSTYTPATESLVGGMTADVDRATLEPFLMGADLPDFALTMNEKFTLDGKAEQFVVGGKLQLDLRNLAQWKPELANVGGGTLTANLQSTLQSKQVLLETLDANFVTTSGRKLLALELKRKFTVKIVDGKPQLDGQSGELLTIDLQSLPIEWLNPFLKGMSLDGDEMTGGASITAQSDSNFTVTSTKPWSVTSLSLAKDGQPVLKSVNIALTPNIVIDEKDLQLKLDALSLTSGGKNLLSGSVDYSANMENAADTANVSLNLSGDLANLLAQPVLEKYAGLAGGQYSLNGKVTPASGGVAVDASLALTDLTLKESYDRLARATLSLKGTVDGAEKIDLQGPLNIKGSSLVSDANLVAKVDRSGGVNNFDVDLSGQSLSIDQLQMLGKAFKNPQYVAPTAAPAQDMPQPTPTANAQTGPDKVAAWTGNDGTLDINFGRVIMGKSTFQDFEGKLLINDKTLRITPLKAVLNNAPVNAKAIIDFTAGKAKPYTLDADIDLEGLEVGTLTAKDGNPQNAGVTGPFSFKGEAKGDAPTLGQLADLVLFNLDLKGGPGVVRTQGSAVGDAVSGIGAGLGLVSEITSQFGVSAVKENPAVQQVNGMLKAISQKIEYDQISLTANRKENLNVNLSEFVLLSNVNNMMFKGNGQITYQKDVPLTQQPMKISAQLWTRGNQLKLITDLKLAGQQQDSEGFVSGPKFDITGTLSQPDYYSSLASTVLGNLPNIVTSLVGGAANSATNTLGVTDDQSQNQTKDQKNQDTARAVGGLLQGILNQQKKKDDSSQ